jgi:hypothetical protein
MILPLLRGRPDGQGALPAPLDALGIERAFGRVRGAELMNAVEQARGLRLRHAILSPIWLRCWPQTGVYLRSKY